MAVGKGPSIALADISVKAGRALQLGPVVAARQVANARFVQEALGITHPAGFFSVQALND